MHLLLGALDIFDPQALLDRFGAYATIALWLIIFAESGLLIGFFLPGDSLLFTAGVLAAKGDLNIWLVAGGCFVAAVVGDQVGYQFGKRVGPALFRRENSRLFKQEYVDRTRHYFEEHGPKTIVIARFVPVVRTFAPVVAGVGEMSHRRFTRYNVVGGLLWAVGITLLGFFLGEIIGEENIDRYLLPIIVAIIIISAIPPLLEVRKHRKQAKEIGPLDAQQAEAVADELEDLLDD